MTAKQLQERNTQTFIRHFKLPFLVCLAQSIIMLLIGIILQHSAVLSKGIYDHAHYLENYVPMLHRYGSMFAKVGREADFIPFFSIYTIYIGVQLVVLFLLIFSLYSIRRELNRSQIGIKKTIVSILLLAFFAFPSFDLLFGLSNIENPSLFDNGLFYGRYLSAVYIYCLTVPLFNLFIYSTLYAVFWGGIYEMRYETDSQAFRRGRNLGHGDVGQEK